jgi:hypothetical protein
MVNATHIAADLACLDIKAAKPPRCRSLTLWKDGHVPRSNCFTKHKKKNVYFFKRRSETLKINANSSSKPTYNRIARKRLLKCMTYLWTKFGSNTNPARGFNQSPTEQRCYLQCLARDLHRRFCPRYEKSPHQFRNALRRSRR